MRGKLRWGTSQRKLRGLLDGGWRREVAGEREVEEVLLWAVVLLGVKNGWLEGRQEMLALRGLRDSYPPRRQKECVHYELYFSPSPPANPTLVQNRLKQRPGFPPGDSYFKP